MTTGQSKKLDALFAARSIKKPDKMPLIDDDTHREWIEYIHTAHVRFEGGIWLNEKDSNKLDVLHEHYLGA